MQILSFFYTVLSGRPYKLAGMSCLISLIHGANLIFTENFILGTERYTGVWTDRSKAKYMSKYLSKK